VVQDKIEIKRALISVFDKTGLDQLMKKLNPEAREIEIISSGGTANAILQLGYKVTEVSAYTGYPESPDGLVKTLHPKIHGGLLLDPSIPMHASYMKEQGILPIDLFVGNLYPFQKTVMEKSGDYEAIREKIDIGGPTMVRGAAKNFKRVAVLVDMNPLNLGLLTELESKQPEAPIGTDLRARLILARQAFKYTKNYEGAIDDFFAGQDLDKIKDWYLGDKNE
jgi:phosphoribosylaminoimidazolecarboxamide formyltransferase/IMP cyclohydrolase